MKHLRTYEESNNEPEIGDYVIIKRSKFWSPRDENFSEYVNNNIGQIIDVFKDNDSNYTEEYVIEYERAIKILIDNEDI